MPSRDETQLLCSLGRVLMRRMFWSGVLLAGLFVQAGCETKPAGTGAPAPGTGAPTPGTGTPAVAAHQKLSGQIRIDGSSTVAPITGMIAEEFGNTHPDVEVPVGTSGTSGAHPRRRSGAQPGSGDFGDACHRSR